MEAEHRAQAREVVSRLQQDLGRAEGAGRQHHAPGVHGPHGLRRAARRLLLIVADGEPDLERGAGLADRLHEVLGKDLRAVLAGHREIVEGQQLAGVDVPLEGLGGGAADDAVAAVDAARLRDAGGGGRGRRVGVDGEGHPLGFFPRPPRGAGRGLEGDAALRHPRHRIGPDGRRPDHRVGEVVIGIEDAAVDAGRPAGIGEDLGIGAQPDAEIVERSAADADAADHVHAVPPIDQEMAVAQRPGAVAGGPEGPLLDRVLLAALQDGHRFARLGEAAGHRRAPEAGADDDDVERLFSSGLRCHDPLLRTAPARAASRCDGVFRQRVG